MRGMPVIRRERVAALEVASQRKIDRPPADIEAAADFQAQQAGDAPDLGLQRAANGGEGLLIGRRELP